MGTVAENNLVFANFFQMPDNCQLFSTKALQKNAKSCKENQK